jgi:hypothetical protein
MQQAYITGYIPIKRRPNIRVLVQIENCPDSTNDFDKPVKNKDFAQYTTDKFKIIKIIDSNCKKYCAVNLPYHLDPKNLYDIVECNTACYLTVKRALGNCVIDGIRYEYYPDGQVKEKIHLDKFGSGTKTTIYFDNGNKQSVINYSLSNYSWGYYKKNGIYKEWNIDGLLIKHCIYTDDVMTLDLLANNWKKFAKSIESQAADNTETNETNFIQNVKIMLSLVENCSGIVMKATHVKIIFDYFNTNIGGQILHEFVKLRTIILEKINEISTNNKIIQLTNSTDETEKKLGAELIKSMKIIQDYIADIEK